MFGNRSRLQEQSDVAIQRLPKFKLPPLTPKPARPSSNFTEITSPKLTGKLQIWDDLTLKMKNSPGELLGVIPRADHAAIIPAGTDPHLRVAQLEQNIRFLQEQHQQMLAGLHQEIETLRSRNRDLQFQLVFTRGGTAMILSTPSSPEEDVKQKLSLIPRCSEPPIQVELLEKELKETKEALDKVTLEKDCLVIVLEEHKQKIDTPAKKCDCKHFVEADVDADLRFKLQDAEKMMRLLKRENDEQRRELNQIRTSLGNSAGVIRVPPDAQGRGARGRGSGARHPHRVDHQLPRFPPLQAHSYWHSRGGAGQSASGYSFPNGNAAGNNHRRNNGGGNNYYHGNGNHYYNRRNDRDGRHTDRPLNDRDTEKMDQRTNAEKPANENTDRKNTNRNSTSRNLK